MIETPMAQETIQERLAALRGGQALIPSLEPETLIAAPSHYTDHVDFFSDGPPPRKGVVRDPAVYEQELPDQAEPDAWVEPSLDEPAAPPKRWRFVRPLWAAAEQWFEFIQNTDERWMLGLKEIDVMTRGFGRGELAYVTGFAHSGKTQVFLTGMLNNLHKPTVLFTFDEPTELVLAKLVGMRTQTDGEALEHAVKDGDKQTIEMVRSLAKDHFRNLMVIDEPLGLSDMTTAVEEVGVYMGRPVEAIGIDYLELLRSDETEIERKSQALKRWVKAIGRPVICLHQGSRGNAGKGQELGLQSMKYGGESEATFVIGVRRKRDLPDAMHTDRDTVSVGVIKNKRPPSKKGEHDFYMNPTCGSIHSLTDIDLRSPRTTRTVQEMAQ